MSKGSCVEKQLGFIKLLVSLPCCKRKKIIAHCKKPQIEALCEIVMNFLRKNITNDKNIIKKLKPLRRVLHKLILKKTPISLKKKIFTSKRGAGILSILLPLVSSLFSLTRS